MDQRDKAQDLLRHCVHCMAVQVFSLKNKICSVHHWIWFSFFLELLACSSLFPGLPFLDPLTRLDASGGKGTKVLTPIRPTLCLGQAMDLNEDNVRLM